MKLVEKASNFTAYKKMAQEELGNPVKYVKITNKDKNKRKIKPLIEIERAKNNEDLRYAGYNLIVTSELDMEPLQAYQTYHNLWKIEKSFRITKSCLDARPVYVQKKKQFIKNQPRTITVYIAVQRNNVKLPPIFQLVPQISVQSGSMQVLIIPHFIETARK